MPTANPKADPPGQTSRYPHATIRLRAGRKNLRHGLALGWRTRYPAEFPVTVDTLDARAGREAACA